MTDSFPCRACGSSDTAKVFQKFSFPILRCNLCTSLTTEFVMPSEKAREFYSESYFNGGDYQDYQAAEKVAKRNFKRLIQRMQTLQPDGELLELGCAYGYFLDLARDDWKVTGIDVSYEGTESAKTRFPTSIFQGDLLEINFQANHFDWIVGWDMIEHVDRPREYFKRCFDLAKPGGRISFTTGDASSAVARLMGKKWRLMTPPSHLTFFSKNGMEKALQQTGFTDITFDTFGYDRSLDFALFRLIGLKCYRALQQRAPWLHKFLENCSFYVDLRDIMWVTARKPGP